MRNMLYAATLAFGVIMLATPASAQFGDEGLGLTKSCPPYCPKPYRPRTSGGGGGPDLPGAGPRPGYPPTPGWRPPVYHDYDYDRPYIYHPRYYYGDPYFARPRGYGYYYYDDYYGDDYYEYVPRRTARFTCSALRSKLRKSGYRNVKATDCKGKSYAFIAERKGKRYKIVMSSRTGAVISRKRY